ncbi:hypothetical protein [Rubrivirga sp.]|uniref:hypothetical protein n=1 Tax=Rubrivirga sp. TaxID=1885344 RepID=UPI003C760FFC
MSRHVALTVLAIALALPAGAQSHLVEGVSPYVSLDLAGGPFPAFTAAGVDLSGSLGRRLGLGFDVAVLLARGTTDFEDERLPYPPETHLGLEVAFSFGPDRSPWRVSAVGLVSLADGSTFTFPADGGPTVLSGGLEAVERRARASVVRYFALRDGSFRIWAGSGLYRAVRDYEDSILIFDAGGPDERMVGGEARTETSVGAVVALPVALEVGRGAVLVLEPELRLGLKDVVLGVVGDGQVTLRLNL